VKDDVPNIFEHLRTQEHAKMSGSSSACTVCLQVQRKSSLQAITDEVLDGATEGFWEIF